MLITGVLIFLDKLSNSLTLGTPKETEEAIPA